MAWTSNLTYFHRKLLPFSLKSRTPVEPHEDLFLLNVSREQAAEGMGVIAPLWGALVDHCCAWMLRQNRRSGYVAGPLSFASALTPHFIPGHYLDIPPSTIYESEPGVALPETVASYLSLLSPSAASVGP